MMRMRGKRRRARSVPRIGAVASQTNLVHRLSKFRVVLRAMHVVAVETRDAAPVHDALHEIVSLHPVLVRRAIRKMRKAQLAQGVLFELPVIPQVASYLIADRPVVICYFARAG